MYNDDYSILSEDVSFDDLWESYLLEASPDKLESVRLRAFLNGTMLNAVLHLGSLKHCSKDQLEDLLDVINSNLKIVEKEITNVKKHGDNSQDPNIAKFINWRIFANFIISCAKIELGIGIPAGIIISILSKMSGMDSAITIVRMLGMISSFALELSKFIQSTKQWVVYTRALNKYRDVLLDNKKRITNELKAHKELKENYIHEQLYNNTNLSYTDILSLKYNI